MGRYDPEALKGSTTVPVTPPAATTSSRPWQPLTKMRAGCVVIVRQLTAAPEVNQRLRELGFVEEQRVKVITLQNNLLCQVCNARLGLSAKLAELILVEPADQGLAPGPAPLRLAA